jgi:hypothetical protein
MPKIKKLIIKFIAFLSKVIITHKFGTTFIVLTHAHFFLFLDNYLVFFLSVADFFPQIKCKYYI